MRNLVRAAFCLAALAPLANTAAAATATAQFNVQIQITAECVINSASDLNFGTTGVISANIDATSALGVQCTTGTGYTVGISAGGGSGATVASRLMTGPSSQTVQYALYRDSARTQLWGTTSGTNTQAGTGNGALQTINVYGRVAPQTTPGAGAYADAVTVTVTY